MILSFSWLILSLISSHSSLLLQTCTDNTAVLCSDLRGLKTFWLWHFYDVYGTCTVYSIVTPQVKYFIVTLYNPFTCTQMKWRDRMFHLSADTSGRHAAALSKRDKLWCRHYRSVFLNANVCHFHLLLQFHVVFAKYTCCYMDLKCVYIVYLLL